MAKYKYIVLGLIFSIAAPAFAAPTYLIERSILPEITSTYYLGTTTPSTNAWKSVITDQLCLTGDTCRTTWPSGSGGAFPFDIQSWGVSTTTVLGLLNGFISNASSTINANLLINGNSTTTSATTTNVFSTTASSTNLYGQFINGFGLVTCNSASSALTWAGGSYGCHTIPSSGGGSGNVATSTQETATYIPFWTSTNGTPATLSGGSSLFTFANGQGLLTISSLLATYASTTNLLATGSSTLQAFTATQSTTTSATTTNFFSTTASSSSLYTALFNGANLATCNSSTGKLTWALGLFGCGTDNTSSSTLLGDNNAFSGTNTFTTQSANDNSTKAATTAYVDTALSTFDVKPDVAYASTAALPANTYANGSSGVGATLTGNSNGPLIIDGVTLAVGQAGERVLVAGESTQANNGWYTITQVGVVAVSKYILTRATESDQAAEIGAGYLTGVVAPNTVTSGANNGKLFISVAADPFTVGTTALTFSQVGSTYSGSSGVSLSGTTFSLDQSFGQVNTSASTTYVNGVTIGTATTTSATSTSFFSTTASSTNLFGSLINGFGLSTCTGTNALTWTGGKFTCTAQPQGTVTSIGVTTANGVSGSSSGGATPNLTITLGDITPSSIVSAGLGEFANLWSNGSSTFQNFTGLNSTTSSATTTTAFASTASSTNLYSTNANLGLVTLGNATTSNATSTNFFSTTASTTKQYLGIGTCSGGNALNVVSGQVTCGAVSSSGGINTFSTTTVQNLATTTIRANELPAGNNLRITFRSPNLVGSGTSTAATTIFVQFNTATDSGTSGLYFTNWLRSAALTSRNGVNAAQLTTGITSGFTNNGVRNMQTQLDFTVSNTSTQPKGGNYTLWQLSTSTNNGVAADTTLTGYLNFSSTTAPIQTIDIWTGTNAVGTVCSTACFATGTQITVDGYN